MIPDDADLEARVVELVREYGDRVYQIAKRDARNLPDAADITQEIWTRVVERFPHKDPDTPDEGWLILLAMNVAHEWKRNHYRWTSFKARALRFFYIDVETHATANGSVEVRDRPRDRIWQEIERLPALQRQVVVLRVFEQMSTGQAAKVINRSEGTVKSSLHRALQTLRGRLGDLAESWENDDL